MSEGPVVKLTLNYEREALLTAARAVFAATSPRIVKDSRVIEEALRYYATRGGPLTQLSLEVATPSPGERLRRARLAAGMGQGELGNVFGYSRSHINNCERGRPVPDDVMAWVAAQEGAAS